MRTRTHTLAWIVMTLLALALAATPAAAQMLRQFEGEVQKISDKKMVVDNKKGDKISFTRVDDSEIMGEKEEWDDIGKGDWVSVHSKMLEKPRKAYKVEVLPTPEDDDD